MRPLVLNFHERPLTQVKLNLEGDLLLTASKDGKVCLVRTSTGERLGSYNIRETEGSKAAAVFSVDITKDSQLVLTGSADGTLAVFDALSGEELGTTNAIGAVKFVEWNQKPLEQDRFAACCDKFAAKSPNKIVVYHFNAKRKKFEEGLQIDDDLPMRATQVKWGPFDKTLLSTHEEGTICIWDSEYGTMLRKAIDAHRSPITGLQFSFDYEIMITSSKDQTAKLWRTDDYTCIKTYETDRPLNDAAISPLYAGDQANGCAGIASDVGPKYHVLIGGGQEARDVTTTAASKGKFEACLYHMVFEEELAQIKGHFGPINTIAMFPNGAGFVTGGEDGNVRINTFDADYFTNKRLD